MATYRNKSNDVLEVPVGYSKVTVGPDETFVVPDDLIENYDLNDNFARIDGEPAAPAEVAPVEDSPAPVAE